VKITVFTKPKGLLAITVGLIFVVDANLFFQFFGLHLGDGGVMVARILGGAYLGLGISIWTIESGKDIDRLSAYLYMLSDFVGAGAVTAAMAEDVMNAWGWALAGIFAMTALGFLWVASRRELAGPEGA